MQIKIKDSKHTNAKTVEASSNHFVGDVAVGFADARGFADVPHGFTLKPLDGDGQSAYRVGSTLFEAGIKDGDLLELHEMVTIPREITKKPESPAPSSRAPKRGGGSHKSAPRKSRKSTARKSTRARAGAEPINLESIVNALTRFADRDRAVASVVKAARELHDQLKKTFGDSALTKELGSALEQLDEA